MPCRPDSMRFQSFTHLPVPSPSPPPPCTRRWYARGKGGVGIRFGRPVITSPATAAAAAAVEAAREARGGRHGRVGIISNRLTPGLHLRRQERLRHLRHACMHAYGYRRPAICEDRAGLQLGPYSPSPTPVVRTRGFIRRLGFPSQPSPLARLDRLGPHRGLVGEYQHTPAVQSLVTPNEQACFGL